MSLPFDFDVPLARHLGFTLLRMEGGEAALGYAPSADHCNSFGVAHGGVLMSLLDVAMAHAARSVQRDMGAVTIEMKTSFMRPAPAGDGRALTGHGKLLHRTRSMAFVEGSVRDADGQLCAHATGTFKFVPRSERPAAAAVPAPAAAS